MADTHVQETAPTLAANLVKVGDSWLQPSTRIVRVCVQVQPTVVFSGSSSTIADVPAGGTGAAAGGWDTAPNRDAAIASINALIAACRARGIIS